MIMLALLVSLAGCSTRGGQAAATEQSAATPAPAATSVGAAPEAGDLSVAIRNVAQKIKPAAVQITNE
jgi:hypothetical protein